VNFVDLSGLNSKYIIAWSYAKVDLNWYKDKDWNIDYSKFSDYSPFSRAAKTRVKELLDSWISEENILLVRIDSKSSLETYWKEWGKIDNIKWLEIFSHWVWYPEVSWWSENFWEKDALQLNWDKNAEVVFYWCNTAFWAEKFAKEQNVKTYWQNGFSSFSKNWYWHIPINDNSTDTPVYLRYYENYNFTNWDWKWQLFNP
jgi:hypothetical protein